MKIDFDQPIKNFDGTPAQYQEKVLTLATVCALSLNSSKPSDAMESVQRGNLAMTLFKGGVIDITPEDCSSCRSILHEAWAPAIVAQAYKMLDPDTVRES